MISITILLLAVMFILVSLLDRMQKRQKNEWTVRRDQLMAIGDDEAEKLTGTTRQPRTTVTSPRNVEQPLLTRPNETGNPFQPPPMT